MEVVAAGKQMDVVGDQLSRVLLFEVKVVLILVDGDDERLRAGRALLCVGLSHDSTVSKHCSCIFRDL